MADKIQKIIPPGDTGKGAAARSVGNVPKTLIHNVPLREGARAPQLVAPSTVPKTPGPVSVTNKK